jgi:predicted nucleic acid-binding protein
MNALVMGVRRQRLTFDQVLEFVEALAALPILIAAPNPMADWTSLLTLAIQTQLTIYDAAYLQLAIQHNVPLATLDKDLRVAAQNVGIGLINLA